MMQTENEKGLLLEEGAGVPPQKPARTYYEGMLVTIPVFMGYASCVTLQHALSDQMDVVKGSTRATEFKHAVSLNYVGNLVFRVGHNFVFARFKPRQRVFISLSCMFLAMFTLGVIVCFGGAGNVGWIFACYFLCGVSVGSYESNMISCVTPLGHESKMWTIIGMPIGFNIISIGGQALLQAGLPVGVLYTVVAALTICAMVVLRLRIPDLEIENNSRNLSETMENIRAWRQWLPAIKWHATALLVIMWTVSFFSSIMYWILSADNVALFGLHDTSRWVVPKHAYFAVFSVFTLLGDAGSRRIAYRLQRLYHPWWFLLLSALGAGLLLSDIPLIGPLGMFFIFFANGFVYGTSTKFIDEHVDKRFNLAALSAWLFIGDIGSVIGSNSWQEVQPLICTKALVASPYFCTN
eukprot:g3013.t1